MILAAVSGGLDSVALLWRLLEDGEAVHVHHVSLRSPTGRWKAEDAAMRLIVPWMRDHFGPFDYSESVARAQGFDVTVVSRECGRMCRETGLAPAAYARGGARHDQGQPGIARRRRLAAREWARWWPRAQAPEIVFPLAEVTRAQMWAWLPDELRLATASCRRPKLVRGSFVSCGACRPCRQMAREGLPIERRISA